MIDVNIQFFIYFKLIVKFIGIAVESIRIGYFRIFNNMERRRIDLGKSFFKGGDRNLLSFGDNSGILQIDLEISIFFAENLEGIMIVGQSAG
jgi:hypothetical protein